MSTIYRKCWDEQHDCAFNKNGYCTLLTFTKFKLGCSFYKKNTEYNKKAIEKACRKYNTGVHSEIYEKRVSKNKIAKPMVYKETVFGDDETSNKLNGILLEKRNVCISFNRYEDLIKKYESEENFLEALYNDLGIRCGVRFIPPGEKDNDPTNNVLNTYISEEDKGFYVLEEVK